MVSPPLWVWALAFSIASLSTHALNLFQSRALLWDAASLSRKKGSVWCFVEHHGFGVFTRGLLFQVVWAIPQACATALLCNIWDVATTVASCGVLRLTLLGLAVGLLRTPRENALTVYQLQQRPLPLNLRALFRGYQLTMLHDVVFFHIYRLAIGWLLDIFVENTGDAGWYAPAVAATLAIALATAATNALDVFRVRVMCALAREVIDLTHLIAVSVGDANSANVDDATGRQSVAELARHQLALEWSALPWAALPLRLCVRGSGGGNGGGVSDSYSSSHEAARAVPCVLWLGLVPRVLHNSVLFVVTIVWANFLTILQL